MRRPIVAVATLLLALAIPAAAHQAPVAGYGTLSPDAPPETAQFGALVGDWRCSTRSMRPDGTMHDGPEAHWTWYYILDGWAIQDDWSSPGPSGKVFHGTNVRSFNPETKKWDNHWVAAGALKWVYFEAEKIGETMVMTGGEGVDPQGRAFVDRNTFYEIGDDAWKWQKDRSFDDGKTWIDGVAHIHCSRAGAGSDGLPKEARQFDFWLGRWDVNLREKKDGEWPESSVEAVAEIYSILGGKAVLELWDSEPIKGFSLRYYDVEQDEWLLWLNWPGENRSGSSGLKGGFRHGRGDFFSERPNPDGGTTLARYSFNDITPTSLRWDDAFSTDGGETWRENWRMEFTRAAERVELPAVVDAHTYDEGERCDLPQFRRFEALVGQRKGTFRLRDGDGDGDGGGWREAPVRLTGWRALGGCAVLARVEIQFDGQPLESFHHFTWNTHASVFEETVLDSRPGSSLVVLYGPEAEGELTLSRKAVLGQEISPERRTWRFDDEKIEATIELPVDGTGEWRTIATGTFER